MIDAGKPQIFERLRAKGVDQPGMRRGDVELSAGDLLDEILQLFV